MILATATRVGDELESGMVGINHVVLTTPETPFGGVKEKWLWLRGRTGGAGGISRHQVRGAGELGIMQETSSGVVRELHEITNSTDTRDVLSHATRQAAAAYDDYFVVDIDAHVSEDQFWPEIIELIDNDVLRQIAQQQNREVRRRKCPAEHLAGPVAAERRWADWSPGAT